MSMSFRTADGSTLDLSNGTASELLTAMGYKGSKALTHGNMPIVAAVNGVYQARMAETTLSSEARRFLPLLAELVQDLVDQRETLLTWS